MDIAAQRINAGGAQEFEGACQVWIAQGDSESGVYVAREESGTVASRLGRHAAPTVTVRLDEATALAIAAKDGAAFDSRNPKHAARVRVEGNTKLLGVLRRHLFGVRWNRESDAFEVNRPDQLWEDAARIAAADRAQVRQVERLTNPKASVITDYLRRSRPMVVRWNATGDTMLNWTLDSLAEKHGQLPFANHGGDVLTLAQYLVHLREGRLQRTEAKLIPRELYRELLVPSSLAGARWVAPLMWFGTRGMRTSAHRDPYHNFNTHVVGRKRWILFSPDQADALYPAPHYPGYQPCRVDPEAPDLEQFPNFRNAVPTEVVVSPGETIMLPVGWFHHVVLMDDVNLSVGMGIEPHSV